MLLSLWHRLLILLVVDWKTIAEVWREMWREVWREVWVEVWVEEGV